LNLLGVRTIKDILKLNFKVINKMNETKIEWADYRWNPVVGCKHGCWYCYAEVMNRRFKWLADFTNPEFFLNRLTEPSKFGKPGRVFVVSMGDLFGDWVPSVWINTILKVVEQYPQHTFMFLTKNYTRYFEFTFPENSMLGITLTTGKFQIVTEFAKHPHPRKFVSVEPIMSDFTGVSFDGIELVIVGAMTGPKAIPAQPEWVASIKHHNIFLKDNIKKYLDNQPFSPTRENGN